MTRLSAGPVEGRGHGAAGEPRTGRSALTETPASSTDSRRPLRLLIAPVFDSHLTYKHDGQSHGGMRWVSENGHPGRCAADHRHSTPESASDCFWGRR